jgi:hypothetical protein
MPVLFFPPIRRNIFGFTLPISYLKYAFLSVKMLWNWVSEILPGLGMLLPL